MSRYIIGFYHGTNITARTAGSFMVQTHAGKPGSNLRRNRLRVNVGDGSLTHLQSKQIDHQKQKIRGEVIG